MDKIKAFVKKYKAEIIIVLAGIISIATGLSSLATTAKTATILAFVTAALTLAYNWLKNSNSTATAQELANLIAMLPGLFNALKAADEKKTTDTTATEVTTDKVAEVKLSAQAKEELTMVAGMTHEEIVAKLLKDVK